MGLYRRNILILLGVLLVLLSPASAFARFLGVWGALDLEYGAAKKYYNGEVVRKDSAFNQKYQFFSGIQANLYNQNSGPVELLFKYEHQRYDTNIAGQKFTPAASAFSWSGRFQLYLRQFKDMILTFDKEDVKVIYGGGAGSYVKEIYPSSHDKQALVVTFGNNGGPRYFMSRFTENRHQGGLFKRIEENNITVSNGVNSIMFNHWRDPGYSGSSELTTKSVRIGQLTIRNYLASARSRISKARVRRLWYRLTNWMRISTNLSYQEYFVNSVKTYDEKSLNFAMQANRSTWGFHINPSFLVRQQSSGNMLQKRRLPVHLSYRPTQYASYSWSSIYSQNRNIDVSSNQTLEDSSIHESVQVNHKFKQGRRLSSRYSYNKSASPFSDSKRHDLRLETVFASNETFRFYSNYNLKKSDLESKSLFLSDKSSLQHNLRLTGVLMSSNAALSFGQSITRGEQESSTGKSKSESFGTSLGATAKLPSSTDVSARTSRSTSSNNGLKSKSMRWEADVSSNEKITNKISLDWNMRHSESSDTGTKSKEVKSSSGMATLSYGIASGLSGKTKIDKTSSNSNGVKSGREVLTETITYTIFTNGFSVKRPYVETSAVATFIELNYPNSKKDEAIYSLSVKAFPKPKMTCNASYSLRRFSSSGKDVTYRISFEYQLPSAVIESSYYRRDYDGSSNAKYGKDYLSLHFKRKF